MKTVLITGASGFLGNALWQHLESCYHEYNIFGVDVRRSSRKVNMIVCDLKNPARVKRLLFRTKPQYIFHFAGGRNGDRQNLLDENFRTTQTLFESIAELKEYKPRIVIPGSAAEYGKPPKGIKQLNENILPQPESWYGFVKYLQTSLSLMYARKGLDIVVSRMFNISGYGTPAGLVIGKFAQEIVKLEKNQNTDTIEAGDLSGQRDFLDIGDVCKALVAIARRGVRGQIYNVCSGKTYLIRDLVQKLISLSTIKGIVLNEKIRSVSESFDAIGSNKAIESKTGWSPRIPMERSLKNTLEYYRDVLRPGR